MLTCKADRLDLAEQEQTSSDASEAVPRYAVLMTVHNRRETTLSSLRHLKQQRWGHRASLTIYVVDDGSTDGTGGAIQSEFPDVHVLSGDGSLFWNGGMRQAFDAAYSACFEGYIWLNDDTMLDDDACHRLLTCASTWSREHGPAIIVGSVKDPATSGHAYGGFRLKRTAIRTELAPVLPDLSNAVVCDTMNGNFVYVPHSIAETLGNFEPRFTHQMGDIDYGLRARQASYDVVVAPGYFGTCETNTSNQTWRDNDLPFRERWRKLLSPKGAPPLEWLLFVRRHYGWHWPAYAVSPYLKTALTSLLCLGRR